MNAVLPTVRKRLATDTALFWLLKWAQESKNKTKIVVRHFWAKYLEEAEHLRHVPVIGNTYKKRKEKIERVFADATERYCPRYTNYRGLAKVTVQVAFLFKLQIISLILPQWFKVNIVMLIARVRNLLNLPSASISLSPITTIALHVWMHGVSHSYPIKFFNAGGKLRRRERASLPPLPIG
ncbi:MAG: transposase [Selenomonadaceae bacterium]|nr:transposase [Selenomonadaceae bacterium]